MSRVSTQSLRSPQALDVLAERVGRGTDDALLDFESAPPIDHSKWFVCPTLTPLYYAPIYRELSEDQQRRYNQLTALSFNELIAFFEGTFASAVLAALPPDETPGAGSWGTCLRQFLTDEEQHIRWWRQLNRKSEPEWYAHSDHQIIRLPAAACRVLKLVTARPQTFPAVFWIMLALEERSLDISRRCLRMDLEVAEPTYRRLYQQHLKDEVRHVQMDQHLIERFFARRSKLTRRINARITALMIGRFFLTPNRSAVRVIRRLVLEHPELVPLQPSLIAQLKQLRGSPDYHEMMYSRSTTPILCALFDEFPEMHQMRRVLLSYEPMLLRSDV